MRKVRANIKVKKIKAKYFKVSVKQGSWNLKKNFQVDKNPEILKQRISDIIQEFKDEEFVISEKDLYKALKKEGGDSIPEIIY